MHWMPTLSEERDYHNQTPLHYVAHFGLADLVSELLLPKVSVANLQDKSDNTALHIAARRGHVLVMKEIISCCPDSWDMLGNNRQNILHV